MPDHDIGLALANSLRCPDEVTSEENRIHNRRTGALPYVYKNTAPDVFSCSGMGVVSFFPKRRINLTEKTPEGIRESVDSSGKSNSRLKFFGVRPDGRLGKQLFILSYNQLIRSWLSSFLPTHTRRTRLSRRIPPVMKLDLL